MNDEDYVLKKLNEAFFEKLQTHGGDRGKEKPDDLLPPSRGPSEAPRTPNPPNRSKSVRERRRSSLANLDEVKITKPVVTKPKRRNSSIQDERSIHDAYHTILNEFKRVSNIFLVVIIEVYFYNVGCSLNEL